jgi:hypothetical protein
VKQTDLDSEIIEREALVSLHTHCPDDVREALGLHMDEIGDAVVCGATHDPSILINRTLGLGTKEPVSPKTLQAIAHAYESWKVKRYFIHIYPDAPSTTDTPPQATLSEMGFEKTRGWMKFSRGTSEPSPFKTELRVERVGKDKAIDFGRIVAGAFGLTETGAGLLAGLANDPRWHLYVSYSGDTPAGAGGLFILGDSAFLEWGATSPEFRRQGSQAAIMAARILAGREAGVKQFFTETGEAVKDDPQHSYKNIQKAGFSESILRENHALPK